MRLIKSIALFLKKQTSYFFYLKKSKLGWVVLCIGLGVILLLLNTFYNWNFNPHIPSNHPPFYNSRKELFKELLTAIFLNSDSDCFKEEAVFCYILEYFKLHFNKATSSVYLSKFLDHLERDLNAILKDLNSDSNDKRQTTLFLEFLTYFRNSPYVKFLLSSKTNTNYIEYLNSCKVILNKYEFHKGAYLDILDMHDRLLAPSLQKFKGSLIELTYETDKKLSLIEKLEIISKYSTVLSNNTSDIVHIKGGTHLSIPGYLLKIKNDIDLNILLVFTNEGTYSEFVSKVSGLTLDVLKKNLLKEGLGAIPFLEVDSAYVRSYTILDYIKLGEVCLEFLYNYNSTYSKIYDEQCSLVCKKAVYIWYTAHISNH